MNYENIYVTSFNANEIFSLQNFSFKEFDHDLEPGELISLENNSLTILEGLEESEKEKFTKSKILEKILNDLITKYCTGKIVYDVAWWAMDFNTFMYGFSNRHFEV
jgi:hypothetical protein